jgi:hypothetical protein
MMNFFAVHREEYMCGLKYLNLKYSQYKIAFLAYLGMFWM